MAVEPGMAAAAARAALVRLLQQAHAGERAAALAYAGHWRSSRNPSEREAIARIEREELEHRAEVGSMLAALGARPDRVLEVVRFVMGKVLGWLCYVAGWFAPMFGAGMLERRNIVEYEDAARLALMAGHAAYAESLLAMAEVEHDHERYFREKASTHWLWRLAPRWSPPAPRSAIRREYEEFAGQDARAKGHAGRETGPGDLVPIGL